MCYLKQNQNKCFQVLSYTKYAFAQPIKITTYYICYYNTQQTFWVTPLGFIDTVCGPFTLGFDGSTDTADSVIIEVCVSEGMC